MPTRLVPVWEKLASAEKSNFDKEASIGLGALLGLGAGALGSHFLANTALKATKHLPVTRRLRANMLARGMRGGLAGEAPSALQRTAELWAGPEFPATIEFGRWFGNKLRGIPQGQRYRALKKMRKATAMSPELTNSPMTEDFVGGFNRLLSKPLPKAGPVQKEHKLRNRLVSLLPAIPAAATEPSLLGHAAVNYTRKRLAGTKTGKDIIYGGVVRGSERNAVTEPVMNALGEKPRTVGKLKKNVMDILASPYLYETEGAGAGLGKLLNSPEGLQRGNKIVGAFKPMFKDKSNANNPLLQKFTERGAELKGKLEQKENWDEAYQKLTDDLSQSRTKFSKPEVPKVPQTREGMIASRKATALGPNPSKFSTSQVAQMQEPPKPRLSALRQEW